MIGKYDVESSDEETIEDKLAQGWRPSPKQVMGSFAPMHACLILDQARTLEDQLIDLCARPVYGHTDSLYSRDPIEPNNPLTNWIRDLGGAVNLKMVAPYGWVLRSAVGYFPNPNPKEKPEAPHHAFHNRREDYVKTVEFQLTHPDFKPTTIAKVDYTTLREHKQKEHQIASFKVRRASPKYEWDYKRKLTGPPLTGPALWTEHRETEPWKSVDEILLSFPAKGGKPGGKSLGERFHGLTGRAGRPSSITAEDQVRIMELVTKGFKPREIVRAFPHVSKWAIYRLLRNSDVAATRKNRVSPPFDNKAKLEAMREDEHEARYGSSPGMGDMPKHDSAEKRKEKKRGVLRE